MPARRCMAAPRPSGTTAAASSPGCRENFRVGRYHSLIVTACEDAPELAPCAWSEDGEVMALRHRTHPTFGVQFHPESVLTEHGYDLLGAFLDRTRRMSGEPVWVNGSLAGHIDPRDRGLTLGDGVFDTLVAFRRFRSPATPSCAADRACRRDRHRRSTRTAVRAGWEAVLGEAEPSEFILRTTVTRGVAARGLWPAIACGRRRSSSPRPPGAAASSASRCGSSPAPIPRNAARRLAAEIARLPRQHPCGARGRRKGSGRRAAAERRRKRRLHDHRQRLRAFRRRARRPRRSTTASWPASFAGWCWSAPRTCGLAPRKRSLRSRTFFAADEVFLTNSVRLVCAVRSLDERPAWRPCGVASDDSRLLAEAGASGMPVRATRLAIRSLSPTCRDGFSSDVSRFG